MSKAELDGPRRPRPRSRFVWMAIAVVIVVSLVVWGAIVLADRWRQQAEQSAAAGAAESARTAKFQAVLKMRTTASDCNPNIEVDQDGTMVIDGVGSDNYTYAATWEETVCVLDGLGAPSSVQAKMAATRAIDGRQSDEWDIWAASWSYHPDDGLDVVIEYAPAH